MSYYLPEKSALSLHIPRTGGTWVKEAMFQAKIPMDKWGRVCETYRPRKHTIIPHIHPKLWAKVGVVFSFVRHPVPYYVSVWRFTTRSWEIWPDKMKMMVIERKDPAVINEAVLRWKPDFDEWLDEMLEEEPGWVTRWFERYVGPSGGEFCHYIGRTETLESDLEQVLRMLGYGKLWDEKRERIAQIQHAKNKIRAAKAPNIEVTDDQRARIERSERVVIRRFFGEETFKKRVYRNFETGVPV